MLAIGSGKSDLYVLSNARIYDLTFALQPVSSSLSMGCYDIVNLDATGLDVMFFFGGPTLGFVSACVSGACFPVPRSSARVRTFSQTGTSGEDGIIDT